MKTQQDVREQLCGLIDNPELDPVGFKREALLEYADANTVTYVRRFKLARKPKKGKRWTGSREVVTDWIPVRLDEEEVKKYLYGHFRRAWQDLKCANSTDKHVNMLRLLDKMEAAFWVLEDQEAIDFIRDPDKYEHSAVLLMTWLSNRYEYDPHETVQF